jgi:predicted outer membrane repeat protein
MMQLLRSNSLTAGGKRHLHISAVVLLLLGLILATIPGSDAEPAAITVFVSPTGVDNGACSAAAPCNTLTGAIAALSASTNVTICIEPGSGSVNVSASGTDTVTVPTLTSLTISSCGAGTTATVLCNSADGASISIAATPLVTISDLFFIGCTAGPALSINGAQYLQWINTDVSGAAFVATDTSALVAINGSEFTGVSDATGPAVAVLFTATTVPLVSVAGTTFSGYTSTRGALEVEQAGSLFITDCTFVDNVAVPQSDGNDPNCGGAGVWAVLTDAQSPLAVTGSTFIDNSAQCVGQTLSAASAFGPGGGAIQVRLPSGGAVTLTNTTLASNSAQLGSAIVAASVSTAASIGGGAMLLGAGGVLNLSVVNCEFLTNTVNTSFLYAMDGSGTDNNANLLSGGAALLVTNGNALTLFILTLFNSTLSNNSAIADSTSATGWANNALVSGAFAVGVSGSVNAMVAAVMADANMVSADYSQGNNIYVGGAAVFAYTVQADIGFQMDGATVSDNFVSASGLFTPSTSTVYSTVAGGGGVFVVSNQGSVLAQICSSILKNNEVVLDGAYTNSVTNGGGAVYIDASGSGTSDVRMLEVDVRDNRVSARSTTSTVESTALGGGGVYIVGNQCSVSVLFSQFVGNQALCDSAVSMQSPSIVGGGAIYVMADFAGDSLSFSAFRSLFDSNLVSVIGAVTLNGNSENGGGALLFNNNNGPLFLALRDTTLSANVAIVDGSNTSNADYSNSNGGGAVYAYTNSLSLAALFDNLTVLGNVLSAHGCVAVGAGLNENGGGGMYLNSQGSILNVSIIGGLYANNTVSAEYSLCTNGTNYNGGGALYLLSGNASATAHLQDVVLVNNAVSLPTSLCGSNINGGGALYVSALSGIASMVIAGGRLAGNQAMVANNTALLNCNLNGGGAVMIASSECDVTVTDTMFEGNSAMCDNATTKSGFGNDDGGGAIMVQTFSNIAPLTFLCNDSMFVGNSFSGVMSIAGFGGGQNANGGGAMCLSANGPVQLEMHNVELRGSSVETGNNNASSNRNGGGALYAFSYSDLLWLSAQLDNLTVVDNVVLADGCIAVGAGANENGGGGMYFNSQGSILNVSVAGGLYSGNSVSAVGPQQAGVIDATESHNGGGALYLFSAGSRGVNSLLVDGAAFTANSVLVDHSIAGLIGNGGGAVFCFASGTNGAASLLMKRGMVATNRVSACFSTTNSGSNLLGGGGMFVVASQCNVSIQVSQFINNRAVCGCSIALGSNIVAGGGAVYAYGMTNEPLYFNVSDSLFGGNYASAINALGANNTNGGGAIILNSNGSLFLDLQNCVLRDNTADVSDSISSSSDENGGGALYALSSTQDIIAKLDNVTVFGSVVTADFSVADGSKNGGGGIYFNSQGSILNVSIIGGLYANNTFSAEYSFDLNRTSNNGGGALYLYSVGIADLAVNSGSFTNNSVIINGISGSSVRSGGGSVYVNSLAGATCTLNRTVFSGDLAQLQYTSASEQLLAGGGSIFVLARAGDAVLFGNSVRISASAVDISGSTYSSTGMVSESYIVGGGAAMYIVATNGTASASLFDAFVVHSSTFATLAGSTAATYIGGAVLTLAPGQTATVSATGSRFMGNVVNTSGLEASGAVSVGGAVLLAVGRDCSSTNVSDSMFVHNAVVALDLNIRGDGGSATIGGAAALMLTLQDAASASLSIVIDGANFTGNTVQASRATAETLLAGGGAILVTAQYAQMKFSVNNSAFTNNSAQLANVGKQALSCIAGGGALLFDDKKVCDQCVTISHSRFTNNSVNTAGADAKVVLVAGGGAIVSTASAIVHVDGSQFSGNSGALKLTMLKRTHPRSHAASGDQLSWGGAARFEGQAELRNVICSDNHADSGGAFAFSGAFKLADSQLFRNYARVMAGALVASRGRSAITNTLMLDNKAEFQAGALALSVVAHVSAQNVSFMRNSAATGGALLLGDLAVLTGTSLTFCNNTATQFSGGAVYLDMESKLYLTNSTMKGNRATTNAGAVIVRRRSLFNATCVNFIDHSSTHSGGVMALFDAGQARLQDCAFIKNTAGISSGGALFLYDRSVLQAYRTRFENNTSECRGGAIHAAACSKVNLTESVGIGNSACESGGFARIENNASLSLHSCNLAKNRGGVGGALFSSSYMPLYVVETIAQWNQAFQGGAVGFGENAIDLPSDSWVDDLLLCHNSAIRGTSSGSGGGGALYWELGSPILGWNTSISVNSLVRTSGKLADRGCAAGSNGSNSAVYGPFAASSAFRVLGNASTDSVPGTQYTLTVTVLDIFDQPVITLDGTLVNVTCSQFQAQTVLIVVQSGKAALPYVLHGEQNSSFEIMAQLEPVVASWANWTYSSDLNPCPPGFGFSRLATPGPVCEECDVFQYAVSSLLPCIACPAEPAAAASCTGGTAVFVASGYWPVWDESGRFVPVLCPFDYCERSESDVEFCIAGHSEPVNGSACAVYARQAQNQPRLCNPTLHRTGKLCGTCQTGYAPWFGRCLYCNVPGTDKAQAAVAVLVLLWAPVVWTHILAQSTGGVAGFKILVFVWEFASLAVYPLELLDSMVGNIGFVYNLVRFITDASSAFGLSTCPFDTTPDQAVAVDLVAPLVRLAGVPLVWFLNRGLLALARVSQRLHWMQSVLKRGAAADGLVRVV